MSSQTSQMDEKKGPYVSAYPVSSGQEATLSPSELREAAEDAEMKIEAAQKQEQPPNPQFIRDPHWQPGFANRFPYLGFGALFVVLLCAMASVLTLELSNGRSQSQWPSAIAPNVILNIFNNIANICFGIAISNGIAIAWWRKTLQGSTIRQLNRSWQFSSSIKEVLLGAKYFNFIALAALTTKLTIIDSTLLQKAFDTEIRTDKAIYANVTGYANTTIPNTGRISTRSGAPGILADNFSDDLKIWAQGGSLLPNIYAGCEGLCYLHVPGAGFEFDCSTPGTTSVDYGNQTVAAQSTLSTACASSSSESCQNATAALDATLFSLTFDTQFYDGPYGYISMSILYTNASNPASTDNTAVCPGTLYQQTCKLRPAVINYPVRIEAYKDAHSISSMSLAVDPAAFDNTTFGLFNSTGKQQNFINVLQYIDINETHLLVSDDTRTRLGGVAQGLSVYLAGNTSMSYGGVGGFYLYQSGNAPTYLANDLGVQQGQGDTAQSCAYQYYDPMSPQPNVVGSTFDPTHRYGVPSVVGKINQIMFALALDISNEDDDKDVMAGTLSRNATVYIDTIHYVRQKSYMWGAFASIIVCVLCVLPVYWGYWQLGRAVTLGPFEIAAAFRAPNLYHPSNVPIDTLIKDPEVGGREVKYGAIVGGDSQGKIGVAEPEVVSRIHPSAKAAAIRETWRTSRIGTGFMSRTNTAHPSTGDS